MPETPSQRIIVGDAVSASNRINQSPWSMDEDSFDVMAMDEAQSDHSFICLAHPPFVSWVAIRREGARD